MFQDRTDAGIHLAEALKGYAGGDVIVFALPRGGVVLGAEIARTLQAPLDLVITKKIGHPHNPEYAICAMAEESDPICNQPEVDRVDPLWFQEEVERIRREIRRRRRKYLGDAPQRDVQGKIAIIVDDGIATGYTMFAAIAEIRKRHPKKLIVAIPVTPDDTAETLKSMADELVSVEIDPYYLGSVGAYYRYFPQVTDQEVIDLLSTDYQSL